MILKKCEWCGKLFEKKHNAEKYCSEHCKKEANLESKRNSQNKSNKRTLYNTRIRNLTQLGSKGTSLGKTRNPNFKVEQELIEKQIRILRI